MSAQMGRPKVDRPKTIEVKARIDEVLNKELIAYCHKHNKTRTDVVREGIQLVIKK